MESCQSKEIHVSGLWQWVELRLPSAGHPTDREEESDPEFWSQTVHSTLDLQSLM